MNCWQQLMLGWPVRQVRLVFHNDDQSSHSLAVDGRTTVAQVCDQLVQCNHAVHSPHWTVVERLQRYQLGQFHLLLWFVSQKNKGSPTQHTVITTQLGLTHFLNNPTQHFPNKQDPTQPKQHRTGTVQHYRTGHTKVTVKVAHTRLPSVEFWSWSRFLAVNLQVTWVINPAVGCRYFTPGLQLPSQPLRGQLPISRYLLNRGMMCVNSLPKTVTRQRRDCYLNPSPSVPKSSALTTRLPSHPVLICLEV